MIAESDREGSGTISFETFQAVMAGKMHARDPKEEAVKAFRLFDDDETGTISLKNLRRVAKELGEKERTSNHGKIQAVLVDQNVQRHDRRRQQCNKKPSRTKQQTASRPAQHDQHR